MLLADRSVASMALYAGPFHTFPIRFGFHCDERHAYFCRCFAIRSRNSNFVCDFLFLVSMLKRTTTAAAAAKLIKIKNIVTWDRKPWRRENLLCTHDWNFWLIAVASRKVRGIIAYQKEMANNLMIYIWGYVSSADGLKEGEREKKEEDDKQKSNNIK